MSNLYSSRLKALLIVLLLFLLSPLALNCYFAIPQTDDFAYSTIAREMGFLEAQYQWYTTWTGRFTSSALLSVNPLVYGSFAGYKLSLLLLMLGQIASLFFLITAVTREELSRQDRLIFALSLFLAFVNQMEDVRSGLYWMAGVVTYQVAETLIILCVAFLLYGRGKWLVPLLALLACGTNEIAAALLLLISVLYLGHVYATKKVADVTGMVTFMVAAAGSSLALLAPGNFARMQQYQGRPGLAATALESLESSVAAIVPWATSPSTLILSALVLVAVVKRAGLKARFGQYNLPCSLSILLFSIFTSFFIPYYSTGAPPQNRVLNMIYLLFLCGWSMNVAIAAARHGERLTQLCKPLRTGVVPALLAAYVTAMFALQSSNLVLVSADIFSGRSARYHQEMQRKMEQLANSEMESCTVEDMETVPASLFFYFISPDSSNWINKYYAAYFGKKDVALSSRSSR